MGKRNKLKKFEDLLGLDNVYQCFDPEKPTLETQNGKIVEMKGKWNTHFQNANPIVLELACGRGEYSVALGDMYADRNFIGVDVKGARIWKGANQAKDKSLSNVAFLRARIECIDNFFEENEIDEIWITFPDPFLKKSKANRRLTNHNFHDLYRKFLKPQGIVQLKTDSNELWQHTNEVVKDDPRIKVLYQNDNIYAQPLDFPELEIKTYYEKSHLEDGRIIKYIRYTL